MSDASATDSAATKTSEPSPPPLARLWSLLAPDRAEIAIVVGFAIGLGFLTLATPIAVQSLVNFVAFGGLMQPLVVVGLLLLFFLAFAGLIRVFKFYVVEILQRRIFVRVVSHLSARLPKVKFDTFDRGHGPELVNRFFDVFTVQKAGSQLLIDGLDIVLQASIGLLVLGFYHPLLLVFDLILILSILLIVFGLGRGAVVTARKESSAKYAVAGALEELARVPVAYKLIGAPEYAQSKLADLTGNYIQSRRRHYRVVFRQLVGAVTLHAIAGTTLLTLGGFLVIQGELTLGQLVAAELIVSAALASFVKFGKQFEATYDMLAGVDKLGVLFDLPLEHTSGERLPGSNTPAGLELSGVTYRYPGLHGAGSVVPPPGTSLQVHAGEHAAILGPRGSGKSTLAELATGLRSPDSGVVLLGGIDLRDLSRDSVGESLDLVQGFELVDGTVLDNIRLGRTDIGTDVVRDALTSFGILDEMLALPDGLRTRITNSGAPLSRSTAMLLTLVRATVAKPRVIVVDGVLDELDDAAVEKCLAVLTREDAPWTLAVFTARPEIAAKLDRTIDLPPPRPAKTPRSAG